MPEVTPRQSLQHPINRARRAEGSLPMRFDTRGREEPVPELLTPKEAENVPPTGGVLVYQAAPFMKAAGEAAKKYSKTWLENTPVHPKAKANYEGKLRADLDRGKFAQVGADANEATRAAMKEAGPPEQYDLTKVRMNFSRDKPYTTTHKDTGDRPYAVKVENFPVTISVPGRKEPVTIGTFERSDSGGRVGSRWYFDPNENVMMHLKKDKGPLLNGFRRWLSANGMDQFVDEIKVGVGTRGAGSNRSTSWFEHPY